MKVVHAHLHKGRAEASLLEPQKQNAGRNNNGRITMRHKGGGHKHHYRVVDFRRNKDGIPAKVERIEYDPTAPRTSRWCATPMASAATSSRRAASRSACHADVGRRRRRSRPATRCRSATSRWVRRSTASKMLPGRGADRALGGHLGDADGARRHLRPDPPALGRSAQDPHRLPRHHRRGQQRRAQPAPVRQGRRHPLEGHPPDRARRRHEPGRPPAWAVAKAARAKGQPRCRRGTR